jgi:hypothetical protein
MLLNESINQHLHLMERVVNKKVLKMSSAEKIIWDKKLFVNLKKKSRFFCVGLKRKNYIYSFTNLI